MRHYRPHSTQPHLNPPTATGSQAVPSPHAVLQLQRQIGNQATMRRIRHIQRQATTLPAADFGFADPAVMNTFARDMARWVKQNGPTATVNDFLQHMFTTTKAIFGNIHTTARLANGDTLQYALPFKLTTENLPGTRLAEFSVKTWTINIDVQKFNPRGSTAPLSSTPSNEIAELLSAIHHEMRHAEQFWLIARMLAARGVDQQTILEHTSIPREVLNTLLPNHRYFARAHPPADERNRMNHARRWYNQQNLDDTLYRIGIPFAEDVHDLYTLERGFSNHILQKIGDQLQTHGPKLPQTTQTPAEYHLQQGYLRELKLHLADIRYYLDEIKASNLLLLLGKNPDAVHYEKRIAFRLRQLVTICTTILDLSDPDNLTDSRVFRLQQLEPVAKVLPLIAPAIRYWSTYLSLTESDAHSFDKKITKYYMRYAAPPSLSPDTGKAQPLPGWGQKRAAPDLRETPSATSDYPPPTPDELPAAPD